VRQASDYAGNSQAFGAVGKTATPFFLAQSVHEIEAILEPGRATPGSSLSLGHDQSSAQGAVVERLTCEAADIRCHSILFLQLHHCTFLLQGFFEALKQRGVVAILAVWFCQHRCR
jgi:hypothetical protein